MNRERREGLKRGRREGLNREGERRFEQLGGEKVWTG